jgi:RsiW-degrading membrane proteinase PrsW (M82 family)
MLTVVPAIICLFAAIFLHETPPASTSTKENLETQFFNVSNVSAVTIVVYLLAFDISAPHKHVLSLVFTIGLLMLLVAPLLVPLYFFMFKTRPSLDNEKQIHEPLLAQKIEKQVLQQGGRCWVEVKTNDRGRAYYH